MTLKSKRIYDLPERRDGKRILIDHLWPRGLTKEKAQIDLWLREIAPSSELRKWFGHKPERWKEFEQRYRRELDTPEKQEQLHHIRAVMRKGPVTLLYAAKDSEHNNAKVIAAILKRK